MAALGLVLRGTASSRRRRRARALAAAAGVIAGLRGPLPAGI